MDIIIGGGASRNECHLFVSGPRGLEEGMVGGWSGLYGDWNCIRDVSFRCGG